LLRSKLDPRHIAEPDDGAVLRRLQADRAKLLGGLETRLDRDGRVELLRRRGGQVADLASRHLRILRLHGRGHVGHGQLVAVELHRIDPDPHRILRAEQLKAANAVDPGDRFLDL